MKEYGKQSDMQFENHTDSTMNSLLELLDILEKHELNGSSSETAAGLYEAQIEDMIEADPSLAYAVYQCYNTGYVRNGHVVPQNLRKAALWLEKGAELGDASCIKRLAGAAPEEAAADPFPKYNEPAADPLPKNDESEAKTPVFEQKAVKNDPGKAKKKLPEVWPGYETVQLIGRGGYGSVYKVRKVDSSGEYYSAVKKISIPAGENEYYSLSETYSDAEITTIFRSRLEKIEAEFQLMEKYKGDSHIVSYLEHQVVERHFDNYDGADILIRMELLQGLKERYNYFSEKEVIRMGTDICQALELIQKDGIIHRDIKPSNILYNDRLGYYKLADFGIAKAIDHATKGTMIGTPDYLAPEVYHKEAYGFKADQYSLGLVLYWALNRRRLPLVPLDHTPTDDELQAAKLQRMNGVPLPAPLHGSDALKKTVLRACSFDPENRYADISALRKALELCEEQADTSLFAADGEAAYTDAKTSGSGKSSPDRSETPAYGQEGGTADFDGFDEDSGTIGRFGERPEKEYDPRAEKQKEDSLRKEREQRAREEAERLKRAEEERKKREAERLEREEAERLRKEKAGRGYGGGRPYETNRSGRRAKKSPGIGIVAAAAAIIVVCTAFGMMFSSGNGNKKTSSGSSSVQSTTARPAPAENTGSTGSLNNNSSSSKNSDPAEETYTVNVIGGTLYKIDEDENLSFMGSSCELHQGDEFFLLHDPETNGYKFKEWTVNEGSSFLLLGNRHRAQAADVTFKAVFEPWIYIDWIPVLDGIDDLFCYNGKHFADLTADDVKRRFDAAGIPYYENIICNVSTEWKLSDHEDGREDEATSFYRYAGNSSFHGYWESRWNTDALLPDSCPLRFGDSYQEVCQKLGASAEMASAFLETEKNEDPYPFYKYSGEINLNAGFAGYEDGGSACCSLSFYENGKMSMNLQNRQFSYVFWFDEESRLYRISSSGKKGS